MPAAPVHPPRPPGGFLGGMRIRKKLIILHTCFSLGLAAILLIALRPAVTEVVHQAELQQASTSLRLALQKAGDHDGAVPVLPADVASRVELRAVPEGSTGLTPASIAAAKRAPGSVVTGFHLSGRGISAVAYMPAAAGGEFWMTTARAPEARRAVWQLYGLVTAALIAVYGLVAAALEIFVLPQNVYGPIRRILDADEALQQGRAGAELIPDAAIPADELGEIMRSRNQSVIALRRNERALGVALTELERVATDLKRKNHLLEAARRNLADADRLASLGMMSAGIAHELNTPLTVLSGLVEKLARNPAAGMDPDQAALMLRVVRRLERLSDSLLDFARVRPPRTAPVRLREVAEEAVTLVRLDREGRDVALAVQVPDSLVVECDADRIVQVVVNLVRNAVDAARTAPVSAEPRVVLGADTFVKEGRDWVSLTVTDNGPGIHPDVLPRLFEPFASTRLDSHGTGLGLAVAEGIIREHGGLIMARNGPPAADGGGGAVFEVLIPVRPAPYAGAGGGGDGPAALVGDHP
ncbi:MAG: HAMP domain-containing histidine kinase [Phycisphaerales bacterium]|nr:HAMP domain-containing histidine kinase [Phycisphaerales bacterium]